MFVILRRTVLLLLLTLIYHSCQVCTCKTVTCVGFSDPLFNQWFPYIADQQLVYKNDSGTADTILIAAVEKSQSYEGSAGGGYSCRRGCYAEGWVNGTNMSGTDLQKLSINASKSDPTGNGQGQFQRLYVSVGSSGFAATTLNDTGFTVTYSNRPVFSRYYNSMQIGSNTFSDVQSIQLDTSTIKQAGAYKFYFARNVGLVAWENYPGKIRWIKE